MNKVLSVAKTVLAWVFVVFCLLMAIGCGSASGSTLFLITAVLSVPLKIIRNLWDTALGIKEIPDLPEETSCNDVVDHFFYKNGEYFASSDSILFFSTLKEIGRAHV